SDTISGLLQAVGQGDREALNALFPLVYDELNILARRQRRAWHGDLSLNTTGLVHEAYLKVVGQKRLPTETRAHFFAPASKAMRHVLCNHARDRARMKRGGGAPHISLDLGHDFVADVQISDDEADTLTALDESLERLERVAGRQARVVECRFFG